MSNMLGEFAYRAYEFLLPAAWIVFAFCALVLGPMLIFKVTRPWAAAGIFLSSYVIGLTTWLLSSAVTLGVYGLFVLVIGWLFLGVGVVPVAIFAAFFGISNPALGWSIIVMCVVVFGFRMLGAALMDR